MVCRVWGRECGEGIDGCLDSFIVGDVRVEECDIYCDKDVLCCVVLCGSGVGIWC